MLQRATIAPVRSSRTLGAVDSHRHVSAGRLRRLIEELTEEALGAVQRSSAPEALADELDYALHPPRHERRIPSYGSLVLPSVERARWSEATGLTIAVDDTRVRHDDEVRRYADGLTSWTIRDGDGISALAVFDRSAGSERDLVVLAAATGAMIVQRHPSGEVRVVGSFGVARWDGVGWHVEPPVASWLAPSVDECGCGPGVLERLLRFAVHDLGARGIGAMLVLGFDEASPAGVERRMPPPPPLSIRRPSDLGPLRHVLTQLDGAALFDREGTLLDLGVRFVPSERAEREVEPRGGTRHTTGRRISADDPEAVVVVVSEAGPVTVFRAGDDAGTSN